MATGYIDPFRLIWGWKSSVEATGPFCFAAISATTGGALAAAATTGGAEKIETTTASSVVQVSCP